MKLKDIRVALKDGTPCAVSSSATFPMAAHKVRVVALKQDRRLTQNRRLVANGVGVAPLDGALPDNLTYTRPIVQRGTKDVRARDTGVRVVAPQHVLGTWEEYEKARKEIERSRREQRRRLERAEARVRAIAAEVAEFVEGGVTEWRPGYRIGERARPIGVCLTVKQARALVRYLKTSRSESDD